MPSLLWIPEDEYREFTAKEFKKKAEAMAFPVLARGIKSLYDQGVPTRPPLGEEPPVNPPPEAPALLGYTPAGNIPSESPISAGLPEPTVSAPPMPPPETAPPMPEAAPFTGRPPGWQSALAPQLRTKPIAYQREAELMGDVREPEERGDITTMWGAFKDWNEQSRQDIEDRLRNFPGESPLEAALTGASVYPGSTGGVGVAQNVARAAAPAAARAGQQVVRAADAVVNFQRLSTILEESAKPQRALSVGNLVRTGKDAAGKVGAHITDNLDRVVDAFRRQVGQIDTTADAMATAIRAKWEQMGKPFIVEGGIIKNGPAEGQAFQDVMSWSRAELDTLDPAQSSFVNYFHNLQDELVKAVEAQGVKINKLDLKDGRQYLHRVYLQLNDARQRIGPRRAVGATQAHEMQRTHETVQELIDAGRVETLDDPATLFYTYAQELGKRAADADMLVYLRPLGQTVRERVGEDIIMATGQAGRQKLAARHLVGVVKDVTRGASPAGASLRAIRQNFPEIGAELDAALKVGPPEFGRIIGAMGRDVWANLKTTPDAFLEALASVRGMEGAPRQSLTKAIKQFPGEPTMTVEAGPKAQRAYGDLNRQITEMGKTPPMIGPKEAPITFSDLDDALKNLNVDQKASLDFITDFYKDAFKSSKAQRGEALRDVLAAAQDQFAQSSESFSQMRRELNATIHAKQELYGTEGKITSMPGLRKGGGSTATYAGKKSQVLSQIIFPEMVDLPGGGQVTGQELASRLTKSLGPQSDWFETWAPAVIVKSVNAAIKTGQIVFDLSGPLVQGLPTLLTNLRRWAKGAAVSYKTFVQPETRTLWLAQPGNFQNMKEYIEAGGKLGSSDFTEALERGGVFGKLAEEAGKRVPIHPGLAFTTFSDIVRVETYGALKDVAARGGATEVADFAAKLTGGRSMYGPITHPNQRTIQQLVAYAADYTRASLALAADAFKPGIEGDLARPALAKMATRYPAMMMLAAMAVDQVSGEKRFSNPEHDDFVLNSDGPYFMRLPMGGDVLGFAGIWPALMRASVKSVAMATQGKPDKFAQVWQDFAWSRKGPLAGVVTAQMQGHTFSGKPLESLGDRALEIAKSPTPFWAQAIAEGEEPVSVAAQFFGAGVSQQSPSMKRNELLDKYAKEKGSTWRELSLPEQEELRKKYPDIIQAQDVARIRQATTGRDEWQTYAKFNLEVAKNRERIRGEMADLTGQFKSPGSKMSGEQYRDEIQKREFEIGRLGKTFQGEDRFQQMPVTNEEYDAFQKKMGLKVPLKTEDRAAVDSAIEGYYRLSEEFADTNGFIADMTGFMRKRAEFMDSLPPDVGRIVDAYVNRNKDPDLLQAQKEMGELSKIPRYLVDVGNEEAVADALGRIRARVANYPPKLKRAQEIAFMEEWERAKTGEEQAAVEMALIVLKKQLSNPERKLFRSQHPLLQKYYSDVRLED